LGELSAAPANGHPAHARDAGQESKTAAPVLFGQGSRDQTATALIQQSQEVIDSTVPVSRGTGRLFQTIRTLTGMGKGFTRVIHVPAPNFGKGGGATVIIGENGQVIPGR
jgi:hypothetical protein